MSSRTVGVGDMHATGDIDAHIVTYALGSCIGLMVHDPMAGVGGMLHFMLPDSTLDPAKALQQPAMFADAGIPLLFRKCYELGAEKKRMVVHAAGGAQVMGTSDLFEIGKRNQLALKKILWKAGVLLRGEAVGGVSSRTIRLEVNTGRILMRTAGGSEEVMYEAAARVFPTYAAGTHAGASRTAMGTGVL